MLRFAIGLWILSGCTTEAPLDDASLPQLGWLTTVSQQPEQFGSLLETTSRDGWIALHQNDFSAATTAFSNSPTHRARAASELTTLHADLAWLAGTANVQLFTAWDDRGTMPATGAAATAALAAACGGLDAKPWAQRVTKTDPAFPLAQAVLAGDAPFTAAVDGPLAERIALHQASDATGLIAASTEPFLVLAATDSTPEHQFWDPCIHDTLRTHWQKATETDLGPSGLEAWTGPSLGNHLFAPWLNADDLARDLAAQRPLGVSSGNAVGIAAELPSTFDDAQAAREESRVLTAALDKAILHLHAAAPKDGQALLSDLGLGEQWRQRWHLVRARQALEAGRPRQALAYADMGRQVSEPVGPLNPPGLLVLSAHAQLKLGHTREALDTLHSLRQTMPELIGTIEVVGDLAVLRGLDRMGDSKEN